MGGERQHVTNPHVAVYRRTHIINIITTSGPVITKYRGPWTTTTADGAGNARLRRRLMLRDEAEPAAGCWLLSRSPIATAALEITDAHCLGRLPGRLI
jgi:hypothetical protein